MVPKDKLLHFAVGAVMALIAGLVLPLYMAFVVACLVGIGKEVYDFAHPETHTCDGYDFIATGIGGLATCLVLIGLK